MTRGRKPKAPRGGPLLDPARAPYARAAMDRRDRRRERERLRAIADDAGRHGVLLEHVRACLALLKPDGAA